MWYDPAYTCTDSTGTLLPCWLGANPFPTLNGRSVLGIYQKYLVRGAISRTELLNISFATTCFEPFLGLLCLLVLIELENFLVRPFLSSFRKYSAQGVILDRSGRAPPSITLGSGEESFHSAVLRGSVNVFYERIRR